MLLFSITWGTVSGWWAPVCLLLGVLYAWLMYRQPVNLSDKFRYILAAFRAIVVFLIALLLVSPLVRSTNYKPQKPLVLIAQDNSGSINTFHPAGFDPAKFVDELAKLKQQLGDGYEVQEFNFGHDLKRRLIKNL
jgi:hypothetical protein